MRVATFTHSRRTGWSRPTLPDLDSDRTLVVVFGASAYDAEATPFDDLARAFPRAVRIGCSSAGEIHGTRIADDTLSVAVLRFEKTHLRVVREPVRAGTSSADPGERLARALEAPDLRAVFVLSDGLAVNGTELLRGMYRVLPPEVVVTGGLAGDGTRFHTTWVLAGDAPAPGQVVAVGLYGDGVHVSHGSRGGWDAFGPERIVTRSAGNVLYELDGEPALTLYKAYLGDRAAGLPSTALLFPLALRSSGASPVVRTILSIDEANQSMTFAGDIPQDGMVQLMRANFDRLIEGASDAGRALEAPGEGAPSLSIAISCVGRRIVLGERTEEEVEAAAEAMPAGSELCGFYSYGEISPFAPGQCGVLHNQTMTLTRIWET